MKNRLSENAKVVQGLAPITPSTSTPDYISVRNAGHLSIIISVDNGDTVTGSAITLLQATVVAGTDEKALGFTTMYANTDTGASDTLVETTVASDTFTTDTTNAKNLLYVIEVDPASLDCDNNFDCIRVGTANAANTVLDVVYVLTDLRYHGAGMPTAITD
ncbi:MAG: hypothetical protein KOO60_07400 [Gemmatimonadales bacterium]|nr:hypothetical protein [Gemmatimonadales bacterium]